GPYVKYNYIIPVLHFHEFFRLQMYSCLFLWIDDLRITKSRMHDLRLIATVHLYERRLCYIVYLKLDPFKYRIRFNMTHIGLTGFFGPRNSAVKSFVGYNDAANKIKRFAVA